MVCVFESISCLVRMPGCWTSIWSLCKKCGLSLREILDTPMPPKTGLTSHTHLLSHEMVRSHSQPCSPESITSLICLVVHLFSGIQRQFLQHLLVLPSGNQAKSMRTTLILCTEEDNNENGWL